MMQPQKLTIPEELQTLMKSAFQAILREVGWVVLAFARHWLEQQLGGQGANGSQEAAAGEQSTPAEDDDSEGEPSASPLVPAPGFARSGSRPALCAGSGTPLPSGEGSASLSAPMAPCEPDPPALSPRPPDTGASEPGVRPAVPASEEEAPGGGTPPAAAAVPAPLPPDGPAPAAAAAEEPEGAPAPVVAEAGDSEGSGAPAVSPEPAVPAETAPERRPRTVSPEQEPRGVAPPVIVGRGAGSARVRSSAVRTALVAAVGATASPPCSGAGCSCRALTQDEVEAISRREAEAAFGRLRREELTEALF